MRIKDDFIKYASQTGRAILGPIEWIGRKILVITGIDRLLAVFHRAQEDKQTGEKKPFGPIKIKTSVYDLQRKKGEPAKWREKHTVCKKLEDHYSGKKAPNPRILYHIHADMFGDNSELQGSHHSQTYKYLLDFLKSSPQFPVTKELLAQLEEAYALSTSSNFVKAAKAKTEAAFTHNRSIIIPGGWLDKPGGHAINYEIIVENDGSCTLRFYNLGAGAERFGIRAEGTKYTCPAYYEWRGISREKIVDPYFFTIIGEMIGFIPSAHGQEYKESNVFGNLKAFLEPKEEAPGKMAPIMSMQQSGTCAWRSLMAIMRSHLDEDSYKRMIIEIKLKSLKDHASLLSDDIWQKISLEERNQEMNLLYSSAIKLSRTLSKGLEKSVVDVQFAENEIESIRKIIERMQKLGLKIDSPFEQPQFQVIRAIASKDSPLHIKPRELVSDEKSVSIMPVVSWVNSYAEITKCSLDDIEKVLDICKQSEFAGDYSSIHVGLTDLVKRADLDSFKNLSENQARKLAVKLRTLSDFYLRSCYQVDGGQNVRSDNYFVLHKIAYFQERLSKLSGFCFGFSNDVEERSLHFRFYDAKMRQEIEQMKSESMIKISGFYRGNRELFRCEHINFCKNDLYDLFAKYLKKNEPEIYKKVLLYNPKITLMNACARDRAIFFSSIVPDWVAAIRDSYLNMYHINQIPITSREAPDLEITYNVRNEGSQGAVVTVTRKGLGQTDASKKYISRGMRFCHNHRTISAPDLRKFVKMYLTDRPEKESNLISNVKKNRIGSMSEEAQSELIHIFLSKSLQDIYLVEYFTKYPEKLHDPDYQVLFSMALFDSKVNPGNEVTAFISHQKELALSKREIQLFVFLAETERRLGIFDAETDLRALSQDKNLSKEKKAVVFMELACFLSRKETLSTDELYELVFARAYFEKNKVPNSWQDPVVLQEVDHGIVRQLSAISELLSTHPEHVATIFTALDYTLDVSGWKKVSQSGFFPIWASGNNAAMFNPVKGRFLFPGITTSLPSEISSHPDFCKLFSKPNEIQATVSKSGDIWTFVDQNGFKTKVSQKGSHLTIQQERNGRWVEFIPETQLYGKEDITFFTQEQEIKPFLGSLFLQQTKVVYRYVDAPSNWIVCDPVTGKQEYTLTYGGEGINLTLYRIGGGLQSVMRSDGLQLSIQENKAFENPQYVHYWFKDTKLQEVEFPRFSLTFSGPDLVCHQMPGWKWNPDKTVPDLHFFTDALVLENEEGKIRVLISQNDQSENQREYFVFDVNEKGHLQSQKRVNNLQLALCLAKGKNYRQAAKLLKRHGSKLSSFTEKERKIMNEIVALVNTDASANCSVLQVFAGIKLLRQGKEVTVTESYSNWLMRKDLTTCMKLAREDEIFLLKSALHEEFNVLFYNRLAELDPKSAASLTINPQIVQEVKLAASSDAVPSLGYGKGAPLLELVTHPEVLLTHFPYYHKKIMQKDQKTIAWVKAALFYLVSMKSGTSALKVYLAMLQEPEKFRDIQYTYRYPIDVKNRADSISVDVSRYFPTMKTVPAEPIAVKEKQKATAPSVAIKVRLPEYTSFKEETKSVIEEKKGAVKQFSTEALSSWVKQQKDTKGQERLVKDTYTSLLQDVASFDRQQTTDIVRYEVTDLEALETILHDKREEKRIALETLKATILELANKLPDDDSKKALEQLNRTFINRKVLTMKSLLANYVTQRASLLQEANAALSGDDLQRLYDLIGQYLQASVHEQQRERAIAVLQEVKKADPQSLLYEEKIGELAEIVSSTRHYDPTIHPEFLVFEYQANILMRPKQVENLDRFMKAGASNVIMEMIMGSGKSKVLGPLLVLLGADGKKVSTFVVPEALFESVAQDTQAVVGDAFGQDLKTLHFDRNTTFTPKSLEHIRDFLVSCKKNQHGLIVTSKSLQCLLNKFVELENMQTQAGGKEVEEELMIEILSLLLHDLTPILDEADSLLDVLHEISFSIGEPRSLDSWQIRLSSQLYRWLLEDDTIKGLARLEIDTAANQDALPLTTKAFVEKIKPKLATYFIEHIATLDLGDAKKNEEIQAFTQRLNEGQKNLLFCYLTRDKDTRKQAEAFFLSQTDTVQDLLALFAEEINNILPRTLTRGVNVDYGVDLDSNNLLAVPFAGPNAPKKGSQFLSPQVTMNYTYQYYLCKGIPQETLEKKIKHLQGEALRELEETDGIKMDETKAFKEFQKLRGSHSIPLFHYSSKELKSLSDDINSSIEKKCFFIEHFIIPTLQVHPEKISCNPLNLIDFFSHVHGFTGTLWNSASMHRKLVPAPAAGTDAKTISILWNNSFNAVQTVEDSHLETLLNQVKGQPFSMIQDCGGYFNEKSNSKIAKALSKACDKPVVFYNPKGEQCIWIDDKVELLSEVVIAPEERITFLDQSHCTGADIHQKQDAIGLVTIGANMKLRDLLQGVWRLRGLEKGQRVKFIISSDVQALIRDLLGLAPDQAIEFPEILRFTLLNQVERQGRDNTKSLESELTSFIQHILFTCMTSPKLSTEEKTKVFKALRSKWIKQAIIAPRTLYGRVSTLEKSSIVALDQGSKAKKELEALFSKLAFLPNALEMSLQDAKRIVDAIVEKKAKKLPDLVMVPKDLDEDQSVEVETEVQQEQVMEIEKQEQRETIVQDLIEFPITDMSDIHFCYNMKEFQEAIKELDALAKKNEQRGFYSPHPVKPVAVELSCYMRSKKEYKAVLDAFKGIYVERNFFNWQSPDNIQLLGSYRKPFHHFYTTKSYHNPVVITASQAKKRDRNITYHPDCSEKELATCVKLKFLDGQSSYNKKEREILKKWLSENNPRAMRDFFIREVLQDRPEKAARFQGSALMRVYYELVESA